MRFHVNVNQFGRLILLVAVIASGISFIPSVQAQDQNQIDLRQFDLLSASSGWILLDGKLFRTSNAGGTWEEITPSLPSGAAMQDVQFIDPESGWVLFTTLNPAGGALFHLAHTADGGTTWTTRALSLFEPGEIASFAEKAGMGWFDAQTSWISVKQTSGSNFSIGTLFTTSDGGETWSRSALPVADKIIFDDPQTGWAVGGPTGDQIFNTQDAGATWQDASPDDIPENIQATAYSPVVSGVEGLLVTTSVGSENSLNVYRLDTSSGKWSPFGQVPLDTQPGLIGLSIIDSQNFVASIPDTKSIVRMTNGELNVLENKDGLSASIVALDMVSLDIGWAKSVDSSCVTASLFNDQTASITCSSTTRFLHTTDGGITWQSLVLPSGPPNTSAPSAFSNNRSTTLNTLSDLGNARVLIGQGFDQCEIPTLSQMQTWWGNSPYQAVNLYIGGSSRACNNLALTPTYVSQLSQLGWQFIPTWVGPQAPCTGFLTRMSSNPTTAYNQGVTQANLAVDKLADLGLTYPDETGSVVYYDIEYYGTDAACRSAVNAFMNGWVSQIHVRGNLAGIYASTLCNTGLSDFRTIANVPDVVWLASWYHNMGYGFYDPTASVWDYLSSCIPSTVWPNHQRIRQYEGPHYETWGNLILEIDSNVLDGVVAVPYVPRDPMRTAVPDLPKPRPVMKSQALTPTSLTTQFGTTSGSLASLGLLDQTGADDDTAAYISFQTPGSSSYSGYRSFYLPNDAQTKLVSTMLLQVNFKGSASSAQTWTWSVYDWSTKQWIKLGDTIGVNANQWQTLLFRIRYPWRYISSVGEIRIQLKSDNANGDAKIDYEALHITYLSIPTTPMPVLPIVTPRRPGISSAPMLPTRKPGILFARFPNKISSTGPNTIIVAS